MLLRLALMTFFANVDLFSEYRRVFFVLENQLFVENSYRFVTFWLELIGAAFSTLFIDVTPGLFDLPDPTKSTSSLVDYGFFLSDPNIFRHLFFFKLPYLLFDIATAAVIWRYIEDVDSKRVALLLWMFNPLTLFAVYIFGRFEVFGLFFLSLTALNLKHRKFIWASITFALALNCREINFIFLPFLLIAMIDFKDGIIRNGLKLSACLLLILIIFRLPEWGLSALNGGPADLFVDPSATHDTQILNKLLSLGYYWFYPIIICLAALAFQQWENAAAPHEERFVLTCACVMFVFFAFNSHSVHYASWLVIFPVLAIQHAKRVVFPFIVLFGVWIVLWLLKTDDGVFTLFLAAPLNTDFMGLGHFPSFFNQHIANDLINLGLAVEVVRSLFFVTMAFFAYRVLKRA